MCYFYWINGKRRCGVYIAKGERERESTKIIKHEQFRKPLSLTLVCYFISLPPSPLSVQIKSFSFALIASILFSVCQQNFPHLKRWKKKFNLQSFEDLWGKNFNLLNGRNSFISSTVHTKKMQHKSSSLYLELTRFIRRSSFFCFFSLICGFSCSPLPLSSHGLITLPHNMNIARIGPRSRSSQNQFEASASSCVPDVRMIISFTCLRGWGRDGRDWNMSYCQSIKCVEFIFIFTSARPAHTLTQQCRLLNSNPFRNRGLNRSRSAEVDSSSSWIDKPRRESQKWRWSL